MHHSKSTEIYKGYALQINYEYLRYYFPEIDNYYFLQPDKEHRSEILNDIFHIINAYDNQNKFVNMKIHSYLLDILYIMCSTAIIKKQDMPYEINSVHDKRIIQRLRKTKVNKWLITCQNDINFCENQIFIHCLHFSYHVYMMRYIIDIILLGLQM